ncbi:MAG TPA: hypothetical protein PLA46_04335 [Phycicoccus sp.]|jgi:hypothetical protein|nr:hypothetical protein [Phycicoccus sp.]HQH07716.1 hypothetical protein [Phycicoccus sp.]HQK32511.1 hypothetical protein [Phycicoccus sp.]HQV90789.1 hypothetical protein [Phycicoccus sp.]HQY97281.1 hypothetical protein [Phycicoccus sp.]
MTWLDALGWFGSALLVFSLMQARVLRFRILNSIACVILIVFNGILEIWPMVAMNVVLCAINVWFIAKLLRERRDDKAYAVVEVADDDAFLKHFLDVEGREITTLFPNFQGVANSAGRTAYLVLNGHETAGAVVVRDLGDGVARVELDYVTPKYRDFTPGEFVHRQSGLFRSRGFHTVQTPPGMVGAYYDRLGFRRVGDHWEQDVPQA